MRFCSCTSGRETDVSQPFFLSCVCEPRAQSHQPGTEREGRGGKPSSSNSRRIRATTFYQSRLCKLSQDGIQMMQYVIYGVASFFFLYGIILLAEGFYTTSAVKEIHGEFKTTVCGRCISGMFVFLTYLLGIAWLGVFGFSAIPVFIYYNMWLTCQTINSPPMNLTVTDICVDVRQYGIIPWNASPGKACGSTLVAICNTSEFDLSYHLFIVACAGAGVTVIALIHFLMILSANWAYLKDACKMQIYQDLKTKEEQELHDIHASRSKERLNSYT
ncbi:glycoprotein M6Bb isoform X2 [Scyliorhinus torazame]|uniref:glycoprotein M6Bb isoform X2 n=1 Tax=Scyliorhinus torazame TaxID=75743 RepID=UPI003B5CAA19